MAQLIVEVIKNNLTIQEVKTFPPTERGTKGFESSELFKNTEEKPKTVASIKEPKITKEEK